MKTLKEMSGMPQMNAAFLGWGRAIKLIKISQRIVDGFPENSEIELSFNGTVQPLSPEAIKLKPEGQRSWKWLQIHCITSQKLNLATNDRIMYNCELFKVMDTLDYSLNNYIEYHLVADYETTAN